MRTFAQKQNQSQHQASSNLTRSDITPFTTSRQEPAFTHLARRVHRQAGQRLPDASSNLPKLSSDNTVTTRFAHEFSRIPVHGRAAVMLQTKCACGSRCYECQNGRQAHEHVQTKPVQANDSEKTVVPAMIQEILHSPGQPLATSAREFMESRFGHDFSRVRVHTDSKAVEATRLVNASAFTVGQHIAFGRNKYSPQSPSGRELLAHELVHVRQQNSSPSLLRMPLKMSEPDDELEREADRIAKDVIHPSNGVRRIAEPYIQRMSSNQSQSQSTQSQTNKQGIDPRCGKKMEEYINENWIKELEEKYKGKTCADYDEFKTDVMSKLGATEFQTFQDGGDYYQCCAKYIRGASSCSGINEPPGKLGEKPPNQLFDRQTLEEDYPQMMYVDKDIPLKDGGKFSVTYGLGQIPPEQCQEQPLA